MESRGIPRRTLFAGALAFALAGCKDDAAPTAAGLTPAPSITPSPAPTPGPPGWAQIAPWPYAPWLRALTAWTGTEVLVFGGADQIAGPAPKLDVQNAAGAFDPASGTWRPLTVAPFPTYDAKLVVAGDKVYALALEQSPATGAVTNARLWEYTPATNSWRDLLWPLSPPIARFAAAGESMVAWVPYPMLEHPSPVYETDRRSAWHPLPTNPWPHYRARSVVPLDDGRIVLVEAPLDTPNRFAATRVRTWRAAVFEPGGSRWRRLPPSTIPTGDGPAARVWSANGNRVICADPRSVTIDGRPVSVGGILDLDNEAWRALPGLPGEPQDRDVLTASGGNFFLDYGWAFDARTKGWCEMPPIPRNRHGVDSPAAVWADGRLLLWANTKVAWAWTPQCVTGAA